MFVEINKKTYKVETNEFKVVPHAEYNNLIIREKVGYYERIASLLDNLRFNDDSVNLLIQTPTHGGFLPIECSSHFSQVYLDGPNSNTNINENLASHNISNVSWIDHLSEIKNYIYFCEKKHVNMSMSEGSNGTVPILVAPLNQTILLSKKYSNIYNLSDTELFVYIPSHCFSQFQKHFHYFIENSLLKYDNLIHLCIMVKNGGEQFENMLIKNMPIIDCWTILDT